MITPPSPKSTHVDEMTRDGSGRRHRRTDQMGAPTRTLATLEIAIRRGCAALARTEPIVVHAQAHRTARLAPFKTRGGEHAIESFALGLRLDEPRAGNHEHLLHVVGFAPTFDYGCRDAQILDTRIGARADE